MGERAVQPDRGRAPDTAIWPDGIYLPTHRIPNGCTCTWVVNRPGPGPRCVSQLKYRNAMCGTRHG
jgi:hypothetical protein